jgi:hypothetical protein
MSICFCQVLLKTDLYFTISLQGELWPDTRTHRGPHPSDAKIFSAAVIDELRSAVDDFSLLLTKGYAEKSALKLVGDRFGLTERQRLAVMRCACSGEQILLRKKTEIGIADLTGMNVAIDGYNLLITIEAAMSGGVIFEGRDGCFRDLASIHGTYRKVTETIPAVELIGKFLAEFGIGDVLWLLDSPVSNSGRLRRIILELADRNGWNWNVELSNNPDAELVKTDLVVVSSDSVIIGRCIRWINLARLIIEGKLPQVWLISLNKCS